MTKKPAIGERAATSGYRAQYLVGASIIFNQLESGGLEWIKIADPDVGRVDDPQICTASRIDAYQVKWEQYAGAISFNDLTKSKDNKPSIFAQLSDGWLQLKNMFPHKRVVVHLVTNQYPSNSIKARLPKTSTPPSPYHFSSFMEQEWKIAQENGVINFGGKWNIIWEEIKGTTKLSFSDFENFVLNCLLDFQTSKPEENENIKALVDLLFLTAANPERIIRLNRDELIHKLGWKNKYSSYNVHEFPKPRYLYKPINKTVDHLVAAINSHDGGYLSLIGSPGSGKSTLLTQTLRNLPMRTFRYYAYVPDSQDPSGIRGETLNFLSYITLKLSQAGIKEDTTRDPTNQASIN